MSIITIIMCFWHVWPSVKLTLTTKTNAPASKHMTSETEDVVSALKRARMVVATRNPPDAGMPVVRYVNVPCSSISFRHVILSVIRGLLREFLAFSNGVTCMSNTHCRE